MNDRELLEKAAKAAGYKLHASLMEQRAISAPDAVALALSDPGTTWWNPLTDDGDEARLEAALMMHVEWHPAAQTVRVGTAEIYCILPWGSDRQAARRRAGVRAAAAIGEGM